MPGILPSIPEPSDGDFEVPGFVRALGAAGRWPGRLGGAEMLAEFRRQHHDAGMNPGIDDCLASRDWILAEIDPSRLAGHIDGVDDPYGRVLSLDDERISWWKAKIEHGHDVPPCIVDCAGHALDGNHRAEAAREAGTMLCAYVPA